MPSLSGRRIVVTRRAGQSSVLVGLLRARGAEVVEVPSIEVAPPADTRPLDDALRDLSAFRWLVFTSANAVEAVAARVEALSLPRSLTSPRSAASGGTRLASIGPATTRALRKAFPEDRVALEPEHKTQASELVRAFAELLAREKAPGVRVLLPCSSRARDELASGLAALGAEVTAVVAYRTIEPQDLAPRVARCLDDGFDLALFASPSAVEAFAEAAGGRASGRPAVAIGPTTAEAVQARGFELRGIATPSTAEGLVAAAERLLAG